MQHARVFYYGIASKRQTGKFYLNFISWIGPTEMGEWTEIEVKSIDVENLLNIVKKGKIVPEEE